MDDGETLDMFDEEQGIWQAGVLAPLVFDTLFTAMLRVAAKCLTDDAAIMDSMVQLKRKKKRGKKKRGKAWAGKADGGGRGQEEEEAHTYVVGHAVR